MKNQISNINVIDTEMFDIKGLNSIYLLGIDEQLIIETSTPAAASLTFKKLSQIPNFDPSKVKYIFSTHIHLDHAGGTGYLLNKCPNAKAVHHYETAKHLSDPSRLWNSTVRTSQKMADFYQEPLPIDPERIIEAKPEEEYSFDDSIIRIIDAPGHHSAHYAFYEENNSILFPGDAAGWYWPENNSIVPTTPPPRFNYGDYIKSIEKIIDLDPKYLGFTHFGITDDVNNILTKSIDITRSWMKEFQKISNFANFNLSQFMNNLISLHHSEFIKLNLSQDLLEIVFGVPIKGIIHSLNKKN